MVSVAVNIRADRDTDSVEPASHPAADALHLRTALACCRAFVDALLAVAQSSGFLPAGLGERLRADMHSDAPPVSVALLAKDEATVRLRQSLPEDFDAAKFVGSDGDDSRLLFALTASDSVPFRLIETLMERLADTLSATLIGHYGLANDMASYLAASARGELMARALEASSVMRVEAYMESLHDRGMLTGDKMLGYAGRDNPVLFHAALGRAARLDAEMVHAFIEDGGERVLVRILDRTDFVRPLKKAILSTYLKSGAHRR